MGGSLDAAAKFVLCLGLAMFLSAGSAQAGALKPLYFFKGAPDGRSPQAALLLDQAGNLYGTTENGGDIPCGCGTIFKLAPDRKESVLYSFGGVSGDGMSPLGSVIADSSGNLYGTTFEGGISKSCNGGCGTVFKLTPAGSETVLYSFKGGGDGASPAAGLIMDSSGNLYGTTSAGGSSNCEFGCGTVFKITPGGTETVLYAFYGLGQDGFQPEAGLLIDQAGNLYGTTRLGGNSCSYQYGCGTVFRLAPDGRETVLYAFKGGADGSFPVSSLIADKSGNLFGTTDQGGTGDVKNCGGVACGTVFEIAPNYTKTVVHSFNGGRRDGAQPDGGVIADQAGNLYGTTSRGGGRACGGEGCGTVFKVAPDGSETVLQALEQFKQGARPSAGLIADSSGNLYGAAVAGGPHKYHQSGTIFRITP